MQGIAFFACVFFSISSLVCDLNNRESEFLAGFKPGFKTWVSKMCYRACSNEQFIRQHMKNKAIIFSLISGHPQDS